MGWAQNCGELGSLNVLNVDMTWNESGESGNFTLSDIDPSNFTSFGTWLGTTLDKFGTGNHKIELNSGYYAMLEVSEIFGEEPYNERQWDLTLYNKDGELINESRVGSNVWYHESRIIDTDCFMVYMDDDNQVASWGSGYIIDYGTVVSAAVFMSCTGYTSQTKYKAAKALYEALTGIASEDPYPDDDGDGGDGSPDADDDDGVDFPDIPDLDPTDTGLINVFNPTVGEVRVLAGYLWTDDFYENILKLWADPMNVILGFNMLPFSLDTDGQRVVKAGNVDTGVAMTHASSIWKIIDCGSIAIKPKWGSYLDYAPYTKISIYLPYCGMHTLNTDEVMNKTVHVKYYCNGLTGDCIAFVKCGNSVMYSFTGNCATNVPVTAENYGRTYAAALTAGVGLAATVATGGAAGLAAGGAAAVSAGAGLATSTLAAANSVMNSKPDVERCGSLSSSMGYMGIQTPYIIRERPKVCTPANQNKFTGYPAYKTVSFKSLKGKGLQKIEETMLKKISCTEDEKLEIISLLKEGVHFG